MKGDRTSPYKEDEVLVTLRGIRSTDPRFAWIAREFGEEPDRHLDIATMIEDQFSDEPDGHRRRSWLLAHLSAVIQDMRTLNPAQELFDLVVPCIPDRHRLSVLLRRMGWSGEYWYTEYEAACALGTSIHGVRNERAKLVRVLRRGPVWVPVLHRCAALLQELAPITESQFKAACDIEPDGKESMTLWGFLNALDIFDIDHWFHLERSRRESVLYCELPVDFGYEQDYLHALVTMAERRIARAIAMQRQERYRERLERQRYEDPWDIPPSRRSRHSDVGVGDASPILWHDIPENCALRAKPGYDDLQFGAPLVMSRTLIVREPTKKLPLPDFIEESVPSPCRLDPQGTLSKTEESALQSSMPEPEGIRPPLDKRIATVPNPTYDHLESEPDASPELNTDSMSSTQYIDLAAHVPKGLVGHMAGPIDEAVVAHMESVGQRWAPIIDRNSGRCLGAVRTSRLRNKLMSGVPEISARDGKLQGIEFERIAPLGDVERALRKKKVVYYNGARKSWGAVFQKEE